MQVEQDSVELVMEEPVTQRQVTAYHMSRMQYFEEQLVEEQEIIDEVEATKSIEEIVSEEYSEEDDNLDDDHQKNMRKEIKFY
jgi:hypothetical protein